MTSAASHSDALLAAKAADTEVADCLRAGQSLLLEAGAGAGKTYSLVEALRFLINEKADDLRQRGQRIACITYTNAATAVISHRIDDDPLVYIDTIHAFFWSLLKPFQSSLRREIAGLEAWQERLNEAGGVATQRVDYDLGYRRIDDLTITLHHDDVLSLASALLPFSKFQAVLRSKFPYVLIDEYQDTNALVMKALIANIAEKGDGPLIGLFGDHWQRIYDHTCGQVASPSFKMIGKRSNFRSGVAIVHVLSKMRPELPQGVKDKSFKGSVAVFHTNGWKGPRRDGKGGGHWKGDLPEEVAKDSLEALVSKLKAEGWDFAPVKTKILMLTHSVLATKQGYSALVDVFGSYTDQWLKKENEHIAFFADTLEPACEAFASRRFGEMFSLLEERAPRVPSHATKAKWSILMKELLHLRDNGSIGDVIDFLRTQDLIVIPDAVLRQEDAVAAWDAAEPMPERLKQTQELRSVPYRQMIAVRQFIQGHTPFATQHSVKGDEFENVLVVIGRGWNRYNFNQFLEWSAAPKAVQLDKMATYERNRNLFYVACSRPTTRLALLFTQELSPGAMATLNNWFGPEAVSAIDFP